jgi:1-acyl-sn-glycerol-3-phosphate acyltransferase
VNDFGCPRRGTPFTRALATRIMRLGGWHVEGVLPSEPRFVLIVAPHTSWRDFFVCILAMFAIGLRLSWLGKHSLFRFPVAPILRWLGGEPIDRDASRGTVEITIERFRARTQWVLGLSPEGTRRPVEEWKTGFLRIAVGAGVPILPVWLDYQRRVLGLGTPFWPGASQEADMTALRALFRKEMARHPEQFAEPPSRVEKLPTPA